MVVANRNLTKMVHVVGDIDSTVAKFSMLFGVDKPKIVHTTPAPEDDPEIYTWYRGRNITGRVKLANLQMGPVAVEFIEPVDDESPWAEFYRANGDGIFSIVITVDDFDGQIERLESAGMALYHKGEYGAGRYAYFESADQLGVTLCVQELGSK